MKHLTDQKAAIRTVTSAVRCCAPVLEFDGAWFSTDISLAVRMHLTATGRGVEFTVWQGVNESDDEFLVRLPRALWNELRAMCTREVSYAAAQAAYFAVQAETWRGIDAAVAAHYKDVP